MDDISFWQVVNDNFSAISGIIGALLGAVISGLITFFIQRNTNEHKLEENKQLFNQKIIERDLKEKREIIKPVLSLFSMFKSPPLSNYYSSDIENKIAIISKRENLMDVVLRFQFNYAIYLNDSLNEIIKDIRHSLLSIEIIEFQHRQLLTPLKDEHEKMSLKLVSLAEKQTDKLVIDIKKMTDLLHVEIKTNLQY